MNEENNEKIVIQKPIFATFNPAIFDLKVSADTVAVYTYLSSKPPNWSPRRNDVMAQFGFKKHTWDKVSRELKKNGILDHAVNQDASGRFLSKYLVFNELPYEIPKNPIKTTLTTESAFHRQSVAPTVGKTDHIDNISKIVVKSNSYATLEKPSKKPGNTIKANFPEAQQFLDCLGDKHTFQTFDDTPQKRPTLIRVFNGTFEEHREELLDLNQQGAGVYVTVNQTDGQGRKEENISRVRSVFIDSDTPGKEINSKTTPHIMVESSPGKYHAYWLVDNLPKALFKPVQQGLAKTFKTDERVCDLSRVMRIPGFWHRKGEGFLSRLVDIRDIPRYQGQMFIKLYQPAKVEHIPREYDANARFNNYGTAEGARNNGLFRICCGAWSRTKDRSTVIAEALRYGTACSPPLPEAEIMRTANSACRYG